MPRYFRYNYIIDGGGSFHGKPYRVTVHSLFFSFSRDEELTDIAKEAARVVYNRVVPDWWIRTVGEGWEVVEPSEAKGIGFYYLHVLVSDEVVEKVHLRHRLRRVSFFHLALRALRSFFERLL